MAPTALLAGPAGVEGEEDEVADCEVGVSGGDGGAEGQDVAGAFVAEDAGEGEWRAEVAGAGDEVLDEYSVVVADGVVWHCCMTCVATSNGSGCQRTVWQIPEYFISMRTSSARTSSRIMSVNLKSAWGSWRT